MTAVLILASIAAAFCLFLIAQAFGWLATSSARPRAEQLTPVDLDAFQNLTDPEEEQFLRVNLSPGQFRDVQRTRIRAAKMYVSVLSRNAGLLVAVGQSARSHPNSEIAASGTEIFQRALRLKVWCMFALVRLNTAVVFPTLLSPSNAIASHYQTVTYMAASLPGKMVA